MTTFIQEWMKRLPDWVFTVSSIIFVILILLIAITIYRTVKRYSDAIGREDKVSNLHEELAKLKDESRIQKENAQQLYSVIIHTRTFLKAIFSGTDPNEKDYYQILQRIVEGLVSDIKASGLERHRCALWISDTDEQTSEEYLELFIGSSGFPDEYLHKRRLGLNNSIAGRSYRKKESLNIPDVNKDSDWDKPEKSSKYKALICIPFNEIGVLTVDAQEEMNNEIFGIAELYSTIIEIVFTMLLEQIQQDSDIDSNSQSDTEE
ncbi:hypothetical protein [Lysinibacillus sp. NPDC092081]|uniref:hypothetical protein n=1 Tax=Lysinibacillus sp. NPDC092081 TaxID=3364131 RepID=UPI00382B8A6F